MSAGLGQEHMARSETKYESGVWTCTRALARARKSEVMPTNQCFVAWLELLACLLLG